MADGFRVDPGELRRLGARFETHAEELGGAIPSFEGEITTVEEAFGLLGPSDDLYHHYLTLARDCLSGLEQLRRSLDTTADGLAAAAGNYVGSETGSTIVGSGAGNDRVG